MASADRWWIRGLPIAYLLHDGEEAFVVVRDGGMRSIWGGWLTTSQGLAAIVFVGAVLWTSAVLAEYYRGWAMRIFTALLAMWTLHGVLHIAAGIAAGGYAFGVVTALPAAVCFGVLAFVRLHHAGLVTRRDIVVSGLLAAPVGIALLLLAHGFGRLAA